MFGLVGIEVTLCLAGNSHRVLAFVFFRHGGKSSIADSGSGQVGFASCSLGHGKKRQGNLRWNRNADDVTYAKVDRAENWALATANGALDNAMFGTPLNSFRGMRFHHWMSIAENDGTGNFC